MISVVIPLYNKETGICRALQSVLEQTYQDFEIVVVDDGSTDDSVAVVRSIADNRIRLISQSNAGVSAARNRGIQEARGEYIALLDADDEWRLDYLQTQMSLAEKYLQCDVFAVGYEMRTADGETIKSVIRHIPFEGEDGIMTNYFRVAAASNPPICSISIMARKSAFEFVGGFPTGVRSGEDLLTWAKLACRHKIAYSRKVCAVYHLDTQKNVGRDTVLPKERRIENIVGGELVSLLQHCQGGQQRKELEGYIAFWYKMRASVNVSMGYRLPAVQCALQSLSYRFTSKALCFLFISMMPQGVINKLINKYRK